MRSLAWSQVNAWRLAQHFLLERAERVQNLDVVRAVGALQAQVMSSAELQLWARVGDLAPDDVKQGIASEAARLGAFLGADAQVVYAP